MQVFPVDVDSVQMNALVKMANNMLRKRNIELLWTAHTLTVKVPPFSLLPLPVSSYVPPDSLYRPLTLPSLYPIQGLKRPNTDYLPWKKPYAERLAQSAMLGAEYDDQVGSLIISSFWLGKE